MDTPAPNPTAATAPDVPDVERDLVALARGGDRAALGRLLQAHERRIYNVCLRMVNQSDDAAELTQDTLMKAVQKLDGFRGDSRFGTWLTRVAMNGCLSHLRKRKLRKTASLDAGLPGASALRLADSLPQSREPDAHSRVEQQEGLRQLYEALAGLDDDHRAVIVLRDIDQMNYAQIAETLEIAPGTVKSRLFRARLALRQSMNPALAHDPV